MPRRDLAPLPAHALTGRKLGTAVLFYVLAVIGVITLEPFHFEMPARLVITLWDDYNWLDPFANVVLFVPPGFLYALARSATRTRDARSQTIRAATAFGFVASACIEITQIFEPTRYPSPLDVATNALGAALGAWAFTRAARRLGADSPLVQRLVAARVGVDMAGPVLDQLVGARLLARAAEVVPQRRSMLRRRRDALVAALRDELPDWRLRVPAGGVTLWVELDAPVSSVLARSAEHYGVRLAPGPRFGVDGTLERFLRLPFTLPESDLADAVKRIAAARRDLDRGTRRSWEVPPLVA